MNKQRNDIIRKTEGFIKAYYKNKIVTGSILTLTYALLVLLSVDILEYYAWFNTTVRSILFFGSIFVIGMITAIYILVPMLRLFRLGKRITTHEAAKIIGKHIEEVNDKLINTVELLEEVELNKKESDLIIASIEQKSKELSPVPFTKAIDKRKNKKYLNYFIPFFTLLLILYLFNPSVVKEPAARILSYKKPFQRPLPFTVQILTDSLLCLQNEDFTFEIRITGNEIPEKIYIKTDQGKYLMEEKPNGNYFHIFKTVINDIYFTIEAGNYKSSVFHLKTVPKPLIISYEIELWYPSYLGKKNEVLENTTDLVLPEGTKAIWKIYTKDVDFILLDSKDKKEDTLNSYGNRFEFQRIINNNLLLQIVAKNRYTNAGDSLLIEIHMIRDEYPKIDVRRYDNDALSNKISFEGTVSDDYGFHDLRFFYRLNEEKKWEHQALQIPYNSNNFDFLYYISLHDYPLNAGDQMDYYFSVKDNDVLHHYKERRTPIGTIRMPTNEELDRGIDSISDQLKEDMNKLKKRLAELSKKIEQNRLNLMEKPELNWMDRERMKNIMDEAAEIQTKLIQLESLLKKIDNTEQLKKENINIEHKEQLEELNKMFQALNDPEFLQKLEKAKKDVEKMNKDELNKMLEEIKNKNEENKENLMQNEELYKVMEFEKKFKDLMTKMDSVAKSLLEESNKNSHKLQKKNTAIKNQESLNKRMNQIQKQLKKLTELNKKLEDPFGLKNDTRLEQEIKNEMNEAAHKLDKKQQKKAAQNQKNASHKIKKMKDQLEMSFNNEMSARMGEDAENMKRLLDNLVQLSFDQEKNIDLIKSVSHNDPKFLSTINNLQKIRENFKVVNDSLKALSRRNIFIKPFILKETNNILHALDRSASALHDRNRGTALTQQQYAMTSMNNLALLLEESLEKMQQSMMNMKSSGKGSQSCPNPGNGKGNSLKDILGKQKSLNNGLKKMKGKQKGKGNQGASGENGDSEQLAKMAALQQQIREMLQEYLEQIKGESGNGNAMNQILKEMMENEKDLVHNNITNETLKRQHDIEVRLLKAENAEKEREKRKERESKEGKNIKRSNQINQLLYKEKKRDRKDVIITNPIELNPFYKTMHNRYRNKLEEKTW